jgi:predicted small lipoprotein YifL
MRFLLIVAVCAVTLAGCGKKGPLYLRESPPPGVRPPKPEPYIPVPYPSSVTEEEKK